LHQPVELCTDLGAELATDAGVLGLGTGVEQLGFHHYRGTFNFHHIDSAEVHRVALQDVIEQVAANSLSLRCGL
jgi:hypothetical protein